MPSKASWPTSANDAAIITGVTGASYLLLYTMYSKQKKALDLDSLLDVIFVRGKDSRAVRQELADAEKAANADAVKSAKAKISVSSAMDNSLVEARRHFGPRRGL
jgi:hypothetical protein